MKNKWLIFLLLLLFINTSFAQDNKDSPMYYRGIDACMSPEEVVKVLGSPEKEINAGNNYKLLYTFSDHERCEIEFNKEKLLNSITVFFPEALQYGEFGLIRKGGLGFKVIKAENGSKQWFKVIETEKWGFIGLIYFTIEDNEIFIAGRKMFLSTPGITCSQKKDIVVSLDETPMYYRGVDAGMKPEEVIKILGKPNKKSNKHEKLSFIYSFANGEKIYMFFHTQSKRRYSLFPPDNWLNGIMIKYAKLVPYTKLGLSENDGKGFLTYISNNGSKIWDKTIYTKKFGPIIISYQSKQGKKNLISSKLMYIINPYILEKEQ